MTNKYAGSEIVQMGIEIEKNGRDFYSFIAEKTQAKAIKDMFEFLMEQEESHISLFQNILNAVEKYQPQEVFPQEYFEYMHTLADDYVFTKQDKGSETARNISTDKEAVDVGIKFEKDSIKFYIEMKRLVPADEKRIVEELVKQEQRHLERLSRLRETL